MREKATKQEAIQPIERVRYGFHDRTNNHGAQIENTANTANGNVKMNISNSTQVSGSQVDMHTLEKNIANKVRSKVDYVMTTVETRVQDAELTAKENLVISRMELANKSVNASSGRGVGNVVMDPDQKIFSGNIEGPQMTTSNRINSHAELMRLVVLLP